MTLESQRAASRQGPSRTRRDNDARSSVLHVSTETGPVIKTKAQKAEQPHEAARQDQVSSQNRGVVSEKDEMGVSVSSENIEVSEGSGSGSRLITDWATADCSVHDSLAQARPA